MSSSLLVSYVVLWLLVVFESVALFVLLREVGRMYLRRSPSLHRDGPALGERLPEVAIRTTRGLERADALVTEEYALIVFATTGCPVCGPVIEMARRWSGRMPGLETIVILDEDEFGAYAGLSGVRVALSTMRDISERFLVRATPFALVTDRRGTVLAKGIVNTNHHIASLLREARRQLTEAEESRDGRDQGRVELVSAGGQR
jgi:methylamine dehydrogenase accessory protein MauD